ncbi:integrase core domain-containing protein [Variovorax sp. LT1R16]
MDALTRWQHHYNWHRPHSGIGGSRPVTDSTQQK